MLSHVKPVKHVLRRMRHERVNLSGNICSLSLGWMIVVVRGHRFRLRLESWTDDSCCSKAPHKPCNELVSQTRCLWGRKLANPRTGPDACKDTGLFLFLFFLVVSVTSWVLSLAVWRHNNVVLAITDQFLSNESVPSRPLLQRPVKIL